MSGPVITISLPVEARRAAADFYSAWLQAEPFGPLEKDGLPEPLQYALAGGSSLMLIPKQGFGWVIGDAEVAEPDRKECILSMAMDTPEEVDASIARAVEAGGEVTLEAGDQPWGYAGNIADPDGHLWMILVPAAW